MKRAGSCKCLHCKVFFDPEARSAGRQKFCSAQPCRAASKARSQRRWTSQPANRDYFRGPAQVERVRAWRKAHPGQVKASPPRGSIVLQDSLSPQPAPVEAFPTQDISGPATLLQDSCDQKALLIGLVSHLSDSPLQETIESSIRLLISKGRDVLGTTPGLQIHHYENKKTGPLSGAASPHSRPV